MKTNKLKTVNLKDIKPFADNPLCNKLLKKDMEIKMKPYKKEWWEKFEEMTEL